MINDKALARATSPKRFQKIIYLQYQPLTSKVCSDFYMKEVNESGIEVEYWELTAIFFPQVKSSESLSVPFKVRPITKYQDFRQLLAQQDCKQTLFVSIMTFEGRVRRLYRILTVFDCRMAFFGRNMFPLVQQDNRKREYRRLTLNKVWQFFTTRFAQLQKQLGLIKPYDYIFLGGELGWLGIGGTPSKELNKAQVIKINSNDYDTARTLAHTNRLVYENYGVFLDEYLPLHPDGILLGHSVISPDNYYPILNRYLSDTEKILGISIVIAAHPKASRYLQEDFFEGRRVFFNQTANLTQFAKIVFAHNSTSINYPVFYRKPLVLLSSNAIEKEMSFVHTHTKAISDYLQCSFQWMDQPQTMKGIPPINEQRYDQYKFDYQTNPESQNRSTQAILIEFLQSET